MEPPRRRPRRRKAAATPIIIGTKNFPEQFILGQLYKQALEAKGFKVSYKENIGSTELIDKALRSGKITFYPEYTGIMLTVTFTQDDLPKTALGTYALAKQLYGKRGQTLLKQTPFQDRDVIAVLRSTATKYGLKTVGDLKKVPNLTLAGLPEFETRWGPQLKQPLRRRTFDFVPLVGHQRLHAARPEEGRTPRTIFTTDPQLISTKYVVLKDPKNMFGFQYVAPVVSKALVPENGSTLHLDGEQGQRASDASGR